MPLSNRPSLEIFLDRLRLRSVLSDAEELAILNLPSHAHQVSANTDFVALGETVDHTSLVVAGLVGRFDQNSEGSRQITAIHVPGDMANLHSVVQPAATSALQALCVTTVLRIPHSAIRAATARLPGLAEVLWRDCMVDSATLSQWVVNVGRRDARCRMAHLMCEIATRLGALGANAFTFPFKVTQLQLADATGLTPVHVNRVLKALREAGLAIMSKHEVAVLDWVGLVAAGDFDANYLHMGVRPEERVRIVGAV